MVQSTPVIAAAIDRYLIQTDWERMGKAVIGFFLYVKLFQSYKSLTGPPDGGDYANNTHVEFRLTVL